MILKACEAALAAAGVRRTGEARVLVACSGGPDSVALLRVALTLLGSERVAVGHVDHGVRPGSAADAAHVRALAEAHQLEVHAERLEPPRDDEATLRALRYAALERMRRAAGAELVLTAHTRDDQAETVLLRLLRGGGLGSLEGMPPRREKILRPLLEVPRDAVHAYARQKRWPSLEDPTNHEPRQLRNRVRKELLPLLESRYGRGVSGRLAELAREARGAPRPPPAEKRPAAPAKPDFTPPVAGFDWVERGVRLERRAWNDPDDILSAGPKTVVFDAAGLDAVFVRLFRAGDRIAPFGLGGHRKVSDVLGEARVPIELRGRWPLLVDARGRVLWVSGILRAEHAPVVSSTREVWVASVADGAGR